MSKISSLQKEKRNIVKASRVPKRKKNKRKLQRKLSELFRTSPLAEIDLSRDNKP